MFWLYDFGIVFHIVVNCGKPEPLGNGTITYKDATYESFSLSSCLPGLNLIGCPLRLCLSNGSWSGYILTGVAFRSCQADGTWSSEEPSC